MRTRNGLISLGAAAALLLPATPAPAATTVETCHPPRYDTLACVCRVAVTVLELVTDKDWQCTAS